MNLFPKETDGQIETIESPVQRKFSAILINRIIHQNTLNINSAFGFGVDSCDIGNWNENFLCEKMHNKEIGMGTSLETFHKINALCYGVVSALIAWIEMKIFGLEKCAKKEIGIYVKVFEKYHEAFKEIQM